MLNLNARQRDAVKNDHPHECSCGEHFREARYAAKHCRIGSTDLRTGEQTPYSEEAEIAAQKADEARWAAESAKYVFGCSCGESFLTVLAAQGCRKCRHYTEAEVCTEVTDLRTGEVVWRNDLLIAALAAAKKRESDSKKVEPLTHNPFAAFFKVSQKGH